MKKSTAIEEEMLMAPEGDDKKFSSTLLLAQPLKKMPPAHSFEK